MTDARYSLIHGTGFLTGNLRDELKATMLTEKGPKSKEMIYKVMERIINQDIPDLVINNPDYEWLPFSNQVTKEGSPVTPCLKLIHATKTF